MDKDKEANVLLGFNILINFFISINKKVYYLIKIFFTKI